MRVGLLLLMMTTSFAADLAFERETVSLTPTPGSQREIVTFPFRNAGTQAFTITQIDTTCGCTTVELEKRTYEAGEKGELTVIFDLNGLAGLQEKTIHVSYDRGAMIPLRLKALLPEAPTVAPAFLTWKVGAAADEQVALVTIPAGVKERVISVTTSSPDVTVTIQPRDLDFAIVVKPASTVSATNVMLTVKTDLGRTLRVFASVAP